MPDRKTRIPTSWLAPALALLAWGLLAPSSPTGIDADPARPHLSATHTTLPPGPPATSLGSAMPDDPVLRVSALPSESEEQDQVDALGEARIAFQIPCSYRQVANRRLTAPRPIPSLYPLRC